MLKCSIFLPFSLEIKTESNTHFSVQCHTKMLVCFLIEQARQTLGFCFTECYFTIGIFRMSLFDDYELPSRPNKQKPNRPLQSHF